MATISAKEFFSKGPVKVVGSDSQHFTSASQALQNAWNTPAPRTTTPDSLVTAFAQNPKNTSTSPFRPDAPNSQFTLPTPEGAKEIQYKPEDQTGTISSLTKTGGVLDQGIKDYISKVGEQYYKSAETMVKNVKDAGEGKKNIGSTVLQNAGETVNAVFAPITEILKPIIQGDANALANSPAFQKLANTSAAGHVTGAANSVLQKYQEWATQNPEAAKNTEAAINTVMALVGEKPINKVAETGLNTAKSGLETVAEAGTQAVDQAKGAVSDVASGFNKAGEKILNSIPESIANVPETFKNATKGVTNGVKDITSNLKNNLTDATTKAEHLNTLPIKEADVIRKGIADEQVTNFVKSATTEDKATFNKMFDIAEKKAGDLKVNTQPIEVAGKNILDKYVVPISQKIKDLSYKVGQTVEAMPEQPIDISTQANDFFSLLKKRGIKIDLEGDLKQIADSALGDGTKATAERSGKLINTGEVPSGDMKAYQIMFDLIAPDAEGTILRTPQKLHAFRERIFNEFNLAKARLEPFSSNASQDAEAFRSILMKPLRELNSNYFNYSKSMAQAIKPLTDFVKLIGYKGNLDAIGTKTLRAGEVASRILGNAADRPISVLKDLEAAVERLGIKPGNINITDQIKFADLLENLFGTSQTRSLRGQVGRGAADASLETSGAMEDLATGNVKGFVKKNLKAVLGRSDKEKIRLFKAFLKSVSEEDVPF